MEFIPPPRAFWFKAKKHRFLGLGLFLLGVLRWILIGTTEDRLFSWLNQELDRRLGPMIAHIIGLPVKWIIDNPILFCILLTILYCLIVIRETIKAYTKIKSKKRTIQNLYDRLIQIGEYKFPGLDWQNIYEARANLNEWKTIAKRLIFQSLGQQELNNFLEKTNYVEERNEYMMSKIGGIEAFNNEKQMYLKYLKDLLESLEKYPELWS